MKLQEPFKISARLAPALQIADAWLSFDDGVFVLDFADDSEHRIEDFRFPAMRVHGQSDEDRLQAGFGAVLSFLGACAESRNYRGGRGENADLFPEAVGAWTEEHSDEIGMLGCWVEETKGLITA